MRKSNVEHLDGGSVASAIGKDDCSDWRIVAHGTARRTVIEVRVGSAGEVGNGAVAAEISHGSPETSMYVNIFLRRDLFRSLIVEVLSAGKGQYSV